MTDWNAQMPQLMPFAATLGLRVRRAEADGVVLIGSWAPEHCTAGGVLHGGALMASADSAAGLCAFLNLPPGAAGTSTIEGKTNFFAAVKEGDYTVTATPVHVGRTTIVLQTDVHTDGGRLASRTLQTQAVLRG